MFFLFFVFLLFLLLLLVEVLAKQVHSGAHLVEENELADQDQGAEEVPAPPVTGAEFIGNAALGKRLLNAARDVIIPNGAGKTAKEYRQNESKDEIEGLFPVPSGRDLVNIGGEGKKEQNAVNAAGADIEQHQLPHLPIGLEHGLFVSLFFCGGFVVYVVRICHNNLLAWLILYLTIELWKNLRTV